MDYGRSFTYMLKSGEWGKIIIGALLLLVPIFGWAVAAGYFIRAVRGVAAGDERLPEWTGWGELFTSGLLIVVAGFVYSIPSLIFSRLGVFGSLLSSLWSLAVAVWMPAAIIRYAMTNNFGAFFEFDKIKDFIQKNLNTYIVVILLGIAAGIIAGFGIILLVIGVLLTYFWALLVMSHLYGQMWRISIGQAPLGNSLQ
jgi:hypothetical protein